MINVDVKNKVFEIKGDSLINLVELEYIVADLYTTLTLGRGLDKATVEDLFSFSVDKGIETAIENINEYRGGH